MMDAVGILRMAYRATRELPRMMETALATALISQLNFERYSAEVYYALAAHLDFLNLTGMCAYMHKREGEERDHAHKFSDFLADRNVRPALTALEKPPVVQLSDSVMQVGRECFGMALEHERNVTARIWALYYLAEQYEDAAAQEFLHWFIKEQVEEERTLEEIMTRFTLAEGNGAAILMLDDKLGGA